MQSYWFGDTGDGRCQAACGDPVTLAQRLDSLQTKMDGFIPIRWEEAMVCGICTDRAGYLTLLREVCFIRAEQRIREEYAGKDTELLQMVRTLDEMDDVINLLSERVADWHQVRHPMFSRKYRRTPAHIQIQRIAEKTRGALGNVAQQVDQLSAARTDLAKEVSSKANRVMPNTSALIGGLVAARLMAHAGGLRPLSRLPASAIQVLGARTALFSHLRTKSPPPKHGIIFQHRRVHNAPRDLRGKVARVLAGKLAIAARLDYYRGIAVPEFLDRAQDRINRMGGNES